MRTTLQLSRRGTFTLPAAMRRKLGLTHPDALVVVEECERGLCLRPALPARNLSKKQVARWIERDEAEMAAFRVAQRPRKSSPGRSGLTG